jgi:hypothetical protein
VVLRRSLLLVLAVAVRVPLVALGQARLEALAGLGCLLTLTALQLFMVAAVVVAVRWLLALEVLVVAVLARWILLLLGRVFPILGAVAVVEMACPVLGVAASWSSATRYRN